MKPKLPPEIDQLLAPVFAKLPPEVALEQLVVDRPGPAELVSVVERIQAHPTIAGNRLLLCGLWLYVDQLQRCHEICQEIQDATAEFWHAILHRREGDFANSHYWFRRVGRHPAMEAIAVEGGYEPHKFVDLVEKARKSQELPGAVESPASLVDLQRREWLALFEWCASPVHPAKAAAPG